MTKRMVDVVTARAVTRATEPGFDPDTVAGELVTLSEGRWAVIVAAKLRVDHALRDRWSTVAARASDALRRALVRIERDERVAA
jgi:hypothetical protein